MQLDETADAPERCETTRGHLLQRHKRECKEFRKQADAKLHGISKLSKKDFKEKRARKDVKKEIERSEKEMLTRQQQELEEFSQSSARPMVEETKPLPFSFSLPNTAPGVAESGFGLMEGAPRISLQHTGMES